MSKKGRGNRPPGLPEDAIIVPTFSSQVIRRETGRPTETYVDVTFLENKTGGPEAHAILFQNYYTSSFSVYMHITTLSTVTYVPLLTNRKIMPSPFTEDKSQDWVTLMVEDLGPKYVTGKPLRFILIQPHSGWDEYEIRNIHAVAKLLSISKTNYPTAEDKDIMLWKKSSLTALMKAEGQFLANKAKEMMESAQGTDEIVSKAQRDSDKVTKSRKKKAAPKKSSLNMGVNMDPTKKERAIQDKDEPDTPIVV